MTAADRAAQGVALTEAERESLRAAWSDWAPKDEFPRPHALDRIIAAVEAILRDRAPGVAAIKAEALREAADDLPDHLVAVDDWLRDRADALTDAAGDGEGT